jgi:hypothetical protein
MKNENEIKSLEKLMVQLQGLHAELSLLAKKSPNDGLNLFKLKLVNKVLEQGNAILTGHYKPFEDFNVFDEDSLPTNSDVTMILALYIEQAERFRSDNVIHSGIRWWYVIDGEVSKIEGRPPTKIGVNIK